MPIFPVRGKQRQENSYKYEANLNYIVSLGHREALCKTNKHTNKQRTPTWGKNSSQSGEEDRYANTQCHNGGSISIF